MNQPVVPESLTPEHLLTLYHISGWINSTLDFDQALDNVMDAIMQVTRAQRGFLMIHDEENSTLQVLVARGIDGETIESEGYSTTIVSQVVTNHETLLTNNAQYDQRFAAGESIIMRGLRAILCAPMMVQDRLIGVVYVDTAMKAGAFRQDDASLLSAVSGMAARAIENARLYLVAREKGRLERELQMASEIQRGLLPRQMPRVAGYELSPYWEAAREVAGDFYDAFTLEDGSLGVVIADVSDKGAPAALFMAVARTFIRSHAHSGITEVETVSRTNDLLLADAEQNGMFVTLVYAHCYEGGRMVMVNGGHNPPLLYRRATRQTEYLPRGGRALGWFPDNPLQAVEVKLEPGDVVLFYTDGLTDAENAAADPYGEQRLARVVASAAASGSSEQIRDAILEDVARFCAGQLLFDDLTLVVVRYSGSSGN